MPPPDNPNLRYRKKTWWLVSAGLYPYALALARKCSGQHQHEPLEGPLPQAITEEQAEAYNSEPAPRLQDAEAQQLLSLASRLAASAGARGESAGNISGLDEGCRGSLAALNTLVAKLGPDGFHWTRIDFKQNTPYQALAPESYALYFGKSVDGKLVAKLAHRAPAGLTGGGRATQEEAPLKAGVREQLQTFGFRPARRGMRRTQHAGQYAPRLCAAWAQVLRTAVEGASPAALQRRLDRADAAAREQEAAKAGRTGLAEDPPRFFGGTGHAATSPPRRRERRPALRRRRTGRPAGPRSHLPPRRRERRPALRRRRTGRPAGPGESLASSQGTAAWRSAPTGAAEDAAREAGTIAPTSATTACGTSRAAREAAAAQAAREASPAWEPPTTQPSKTGRGAVEPRMRRAQAAAAGAQGPPWQPTRTRSPTRRASSKAPR